MPLPESQKDICIDEETAGALEKVVNAIISKMNTEKAVQVAVQNYINEIVGGTEAIVTLYDQIEVIAKQVMDDKLRAFAKELDDASHSCA